MSVKLLLVFILGAHSYHIYPTNVTGNSVLLHFDWNYDEDASFVSWNLELERGEEIVWHQYVYSKLSSMQLRNLEDWTDYTFIIKPERERYFRNTIYVNIRNPIYPIGVQFSTIPVNLSIKSVYPNLEGQAIVNVNIQIFKAENYFWRLETKEIDEEDFNSKTAWTQVRRYGDNECLISIEKEIKVVLMRIHIKTFEPPFEEYFGPYRLVSI